MKIKRNENLKYIKGPADWFTGEMQVKMLFDPIEESGRTGGAEVIFEPRARTAWHTHPLGQTLLITDGIGWVQVEGEKKQEVKVGDVVQFDPKEKHWHGATDKNSMTHLAIQEYKDGKSVDWMEKVEDEDYLS